jgi:ribosomal protein S4E
LSAFKRKKMKQVVLNIPESEYRFFMKVVKSFPFVEVDEKKNKLLELEAKLSSAKGKIWNNIKEGLVEVELIEQGKIKGKTANDFLRDL